MKVLMTTDAVGGVWTYALDLCRALAPHGVEFLVATMGRRPDEAQRAEAVGLRNVRLVESDYKLEWEESPWRDIEESGEWLLELEKEYTPDVVHLNGYAQGVCAFRAPKIVVAHSDVLSWWQAVKGEEAPHEWNEYQNRVRSGLLAADVVVAPTRAMLNAVVEIYDLPAASSTRTILNGRDATHFVPREKESYVFSAGRLWDEAKNVAALQRAASHVRWPIRVAGESRINQHSAVEFLGRLPLNELVEKMARASIYALPARYEPFGLSALEAALCGCSLVLGDVATLREVWGDAALFVAPDDEKQLAATLNELIDNPKLREEMGRRAQNCARKYSLEKFGEGYLSLYGSFQVSA